MAKITPGCPSTLDEHAAHAAEYQRALDEEFARMARHAGSLLFSGDDIPLVRDAVKHVSLLPWMHHMLTLLTSDKRVFGLELPARDSWLLAGAWDYESDDPRADAPTLSSRLWLKTSGGIELWVCQYVSLVRDVYLDPHFSFAYEFHLHGKGPVDLDVYTETQQFAKELLPMDNPSLAISAFGQVLNGAVMLTWLDQQEG